MFDKFDLEDEERIKQTSLTTNYRTPIEVMTEAEKVIRAVLPDANVPTSIRSTGVPIRHGVVAELTTLLDSWLATHRDGVACVITTEDVEDQLPDSPRVRALSPELTKGPEFDLVVLSNPSSFGEGIEGTVDRYVAMTRTTSELITLGD